MTVEIETAFATSVGLSVPALRRQLLLGRRVEELRPTERSHPDFGRGVASGSDTYLYGAEALRLFLIRETA